MIATIRVTIRFWYCAVVLSALLACSARENSSVEPPVAADLSAADVEIAAMLKPLLVQAQAAPQEAERRGQLGMAYEVNGFAEAALASYVQAQALDPGEPRWPYHQAMLLAHRGDLEGALVHLQASTDLDGNYAAAWLWRGTWLLDLDRVHDARAAFERAGTLSSGQPDIELAVEVGRARVLLREQQPTEALELLKQLPAEHAHVARLLMQAHTRLGQTEAAKQAWGRAQESLPLVWPDARSREKKQYEASLSARLGRARELIQNGEPEQALAIAEPLRDHHPGHQGLLGTLGEAYRLAGRPERALAVLQHGANAHPSHYPFHLSIAEHHIQAGDGDRAMAHLERAIELNPAVSWAHAQRGLLLLELGSTQDALEAFESSLRYDPNNAMVNYYAGMVQASRSRWRQAITLFRVSVRTDPEFTLGFIALCQSLTELGRFKEAEAELDRADRLGTHQQELRAAREMLLRREQGAS